MYSVSCFIILIFWILFYYYYVFLKLLSLFKFTYYRYIISLLITTILITLTSLSYIAKPSRPVEYFQNNIDKIIYYLAVINMIIKAFIPILMFFYIRILNVIFEREKKEFLLYNFQEDEISNTKSQNPSGNKSFTMNTMNTVDTNTNDNEINQENVSNVDIMKNYVSNNASQENTKCNTTNNKTTRKSLIRTSNTNTNTKTKTVNKNNDEYIHNQGGNTDRSNDKIDETEKNSKEKYHTNMNTVI